ALEYVASWVGLAVSRADTVSQPRSRSAAGRLPLSPVWLGSAAMSEGLARPSLPEANTTRPSLLKMKGRYSLAMGAVALRLVQYNPPQELFMIRMPAAIKSLWIGRKPNAPLTSLPLPEPSSTGALSAMIRADRMPAPGAMPPGQLPTTAPA